MHHYFQGTRGAEAFNAAPVGSKLHFQGHLHCHPPFEELLNQSVINRGSAAERQQGKGGVEETIITVLYLDL